VRRAGLVPRRHDLDAEPMQGGIEAEVGAVDDAGHLLDAFGLKNARQDFPAAGLRHAVFPRFFCLQGFA
jgi:hypothetical protein